MNYKFQITEEAAQPVLSIRKRTSVQELPGELAQAYGEIISYLQEIGEQPLKFAFAAYYNMDMENLDVEMGFPVSRVIPGKGAIQAGEIPAGKQASYFHKGPYHEMEVAYKAMMEWIQEQGQTPTGVAYEFYFNAPEQVDESNLLTKIVFPLK